MKKKPKRILVSLKTSMLKYYNNIIQAGWLASLALLLHVIQISSIT